MICCSVFYCCLLVQEFFWSWSWRSISTGSDRLSPHRNSDFLQMTPHNNNFETSSMTNSPTTSMDSSYTSGNSSQGNTDSLEPFSTQSNNTSSTSFEESVASASPTSPGSLQTPVSTETLGHSSSTKIMTTRSVHDYLSSAFRVTSTRKRKVYIRILFSNYNISEESELLINSPNLLELHVLLDELHYRDIWRTR